MQAEREGQVPAGIWPADAELVGVLEDLRVAVAPPMNTMTGRPAAITVPPTSTSSMATREVSWTGLS
jgi:hypothetical protein